MNYKKLYDSLIQKFLDIPHVGYLERHHIVPRCQGGSDDLSNLVGMSARGHYLAHKLLCKIYPDHRGLAFGLFMMSNREDYTVSSKTYQIIKENISRLGPTKETIEKMRIAQKKSPETRAKLSAAHKGKIVSKETRERQSIVQRGKKRTDEVKAKLSQGQRNRSVESRARSGVSQRLRYQDPLVRQEQSEKMKGRSKSPETKENMRLGWIVRKAKALENLQLGIIPKKIIRPEHSQETKDKISAILKFRKVSQETKSKISSALKFIPKSEETKAKISATKRSRKVGD